MATSSRRLGFDSQDRHQRVTRLLEGKKIFPEPTSTSKEQNRKLYQLRDYAAAALVEIDVDMTCGG
jgi:hypothetical protein